MKVFALEWSSPSHIEFLESLHDSGWNLAYWSGSLQRGFPIEKLKNLNPKMILHPTERAILAEMPLGFIKKPIEPVSADFLEALLPYETLALSMMDRMEYRPTSLSERRLHYRRLVGFWTYLLQKEKPDLVINSVTPHMIYDFVAFAVCRVLNIPHLNFDYTRTPGRLLLVNDPWLGEERLKINSKKFLDLSKIELLNLIDPKTKSYYEKHQNTNPQATGDATPFYIKKFSETGVFNLWRKKMAQNIKRWGFLRTIKREWISQFTKPHLYTLGKPLTGIDYQLAKLSWLRTKNKLLKEYQTYSTSWPNPSLLKSPYVYFALQYQPERTTSPLGGVYANQLLAIHTLSEALPSHWSILVKEHPRQLHPRGSHAHQGRYLGYYKKLSQIPKVKIVPQKASTFELMENAKIVSTVAGTPVWEAFLRGIPGIVWGYPWYHAIHGIYHADSTQSCSQIFKTLLEKDFKGPTEHEILAALAAVSSCTIEGYVDPIYEKETKLSAQVAYQNLAKTLVSSYNRPHV